MDQHKVSPLFCTRTAFCRVYFFVRDQITLKLQFVYLCKCIFVLSLFHSLQVLGSLSLGRKLVNDVIVQTGSQKISHGTNGSYQKFYVKGDLCMYVCVSVCVCVCVVVFV